MRRNPLFSFAPTRRLRRLRGAGLCAALLLPLAAGAVEAPDAPVPPQRLYNDGTRKLGEKKLKDAEVLLQNAVASQQDALQAPALYNLGEVRFAQGAEELKKGPNGKAAQATADHAGETGRSALNAADAALAGEDLNAIVRAYQQGRGARKELKAATEAVKKALESKSVVLRKWQRAAGDFAGAHELDPRDEDARHNAEVVNRSIARLVDQVQMMMQGMTGLQKQRQELGAKMGQLREKMPGDLGQKMKGGDEEDDEEDGRKPKEPKEGQEEGPVKEGKEMPMTPDDAERLLGMLRLDGNRKLSLGGDEPGKPRAGKLRDW